VSGSRLLASPEFQEFLRHLEEPSIRAVVTKEFSRLMRPENFNDFAILQCFVDNSITLHLPDGPIDFSKKFDKFMATIKAGMAGMELEELRRRMDDAKEEMRRQGKHPGGSHTLPKGIAYSNKEGWHYTPEIELVKRIFRLFQTGEHNLAEISRQTGIPRPTVAYTLKNAAYTGWMVYDEKRDRSLAGYVAKPNGKQGYRKKIKREPDEIIRVKLPLEPLLSKEEFQAIQTILERRRRAVNKARGRPQFTYNGFLRCGDCDALLYTHHSGAYYFYYCSSKRKARACTNKYMLRDKLEPKIDTLVEQRLIEPSFLSPIIESYLDQHSGLDPSQETINERLESLQKKRSRVLDSFFDGTITKKERDRALKAIQAEDAAFKKITPLKSKSFTSTQIIDVVSVFKEWPFLGRTHKRSLLDQLVPEIFIHRYHIKGLTLRIDGDKLNPSKTVKSRLAGQHAP